MLVHAVFGRCLYEFCNMLGRNVELDDYAMRRIFNRVVRVIMLRGRNYIQVSIEDPCRGVCA